MTSSTNVDRVTMPAVWLWLLRLGCPVVGFALGFVLGPVAGWIAATIPFAPGPLEAEREALVVNVSSDGLLMERGEAETYVPRSRVDAVFTDPRDLVVLDPSGHEAYRAPATDLPVDALEAALRRHGYRWEGTRDPYEDAYRRWVDGDPDLGPDVHALLRHRRRALANGNDAEAEDLRARLQESGIVVRERSGKQQVRRTVNRAD